MKRNRIKKARKHNICIRCGAFKDQKKLKCWSWGIVYKKHKFTYE